MLVAALTWSSSFAITKVELNDLPPVTIGALRLSIATVILGVIVRCRRDRLQPTRRQQGGLAVAGLLGITAYFASSTSPSTGRGPSGRAIWRRGTPSG